MNLCPLEDDGSMGPIISDFNLGLLRKGVITKTFSPKVRKVGGISYFVLSLGVFSH